MSTSDAVATLWPAGVAQPIIRLGMRVEGWWRSAAWVAATTMFLCLTWAIIAQHGAPLRIDVVLHEWALSHRPRAATTIARIVTGTGSDIWPYVLASVTGWVACGTQATPLRRLATASAIALDVIVGELVVRGSLSAAIARPRPPVADWATSASGGSFPSGHTTASAIAAGLIIWSARRIGPRAVAHVVAAVAASWAATVGLSRVYLGVHWPTDVLGGWALAVVWLALTVPVLDSLVPSGAQAR